MEEIWKDVVWYEGLYQVSNLGRVRSLERTIERKKFGSIIVQSSILKQYDNGTGYLRVVLYDQNHKAKKAYVHRIVAMTFVDNPMGYPNINHKDENKHSNIATNLEWCTQKYNINYGTRTKRASKTRSISVVAINVKTGERTIYKSVSEAVRNGFFFNRIKDCCTGIRKTHKGFYWNYK